MAATDALPRGCDIVSVNNELRLRAAGNLGNNPVVWVSERVNPSQEKTHAHNTAKHRGWMRNIRNARSRGFSARSAASHVAARGTGSAGFENRSVSGSFAGAGFGGRHLY